MEMKPVFVWRTMNPEILEWCLKGSLWEAFLDDSKDQEAVGEIMEFRD